MKRPAILFAALALAVTAATAWAASVGDTRAGKALAVRICHDCHVVAPNMEKPYNAAFGAPSFLNLADDAAVTEFRLRRFLSTPHFRMPNIKLSEKETDDVIAYILSLKEI